jgi:hypothetical protein
MSKTMILVLAVAIVGYLIVSGKLKLPGMAVGVPASKVTGPAANVSNGAAPSRTDQLEQMAFGILDQKAGSFFGGQTGLFA